MSANSNVLAVILICMNRWFILVMKALMLLIRMQKVSKSIKYKNIKYITYEEKKYAKELTEIEGDAIETADKINEYVKGLTE